MKNTIKTGNQVMADDNHRPDAPQLEQCHDAWRLSASQFLLVNNNPILVLFSPNARKNRKALHLLI